MRRPTEPPPDLTVAGSLGSERLARTEAPVPMIRPMPLVTFDEPGDPTLADGPGSYSTLLVSGTVKDLLSLLSDTPASEIARLPGRASRSPTPGRSG